VRACQSIGFTKEKALSLITDISSLEQNIPYKDIRQQCYELFDSDPTFKSECLLATDWVLKGYTLKNAPFAQKDEAIHYLLKELPLLLDTPSILDIPASVFCYHQTPDFIKFIYNVSTRSSLLSLQQGFLEVVQTKEKPIQGGGIEQEHVL